VQEIYKDRKKFSKAVFEVASSDLVNMGISVVSYTLKDLKDDEVGLNETSLVLVSFRDRTPCMSKIQIAEQMDTLYELQKVVVIMFVK